MAVDTTGNITTLQGNDVTTDFPFNFKVLDQDHLIVQRKVAATGVVDKTYLSSEYTLTLTDNGGTVTFSQAPDSDSLIMIQRIVPLKQELDITNQGGFYPDTTETEMDKIVMMVQQLQDQVNRAIYVPAGDSGLPLIADKSVRKDRVVGFDEEGEITLIPTGTFKGDPGSPGEGYGSLAALADAGNTATNLDDAYLTLEGREGKFVFSTADLSAYVEVDTKKGIFVPPTNAPSGASGAWVRQHDGVFRVGWFGTFENPEVNHEIIQCAIDLTLLVPASVAIPDRQIETKQPIFHVDYLEVFGEGSNSEIYNTNNGVNSARRICWIMGQDHPAYLATNTNGGKTVRFTWHAGGAITSGSYSMTLTTASDSDNYEPGDKVYVRTVGYYRGGGNTEDPHYGQSNIVVASSAGVVTFKYPIIGTYPDSLISNRTKEVYIDTVTQGGDTWTGRQVQCCVGAKLTNVGLRCDISTGHGFARCAPLDCDVDVRVDAPEALWFNNAVFCRLKAVAQIHDKAMECAMNCIGSVYEIHANYINTAGASTQMAVKFGECSSFNTVYLYMKGDFNPGSNVGVVEFDNGDGNTVIVRELNIPQHTGPIFTFSSTVRGGVTDAGETQEPSRNNKVILECDVITGTPTRFIYVNDLAGTVTNCGVMNGRILGNPSSSAITFGSSVNGGTNCYVINTFLENGNINTSLSHGARIDVRGNLTLASNYYLGCSMMIINGVEQYVYGELVAHTSGNRTLDMSKKKQTITVATSITFNAVTLSQIGSVCHVTIVNNSGGAMTPALNATIFQANGWTPPSMANGESLTLTFMRVPCVSGTKVVVLNPTPSL